MWFEIIPSFAIITVTLAIPPVVKHFGHLLIFGNATIRDKTHVWEGFMFQRDERLTGDPYKAKGLEAIPDE
ncbi:uncharacterized protein LOC110835271 [Zootermopsis nevadensis]|uniref:NADH dehydrogenase [ubiquinone] 1 alpha subcomplex subunit 1 n=1 Tax=Zootermopsis nevadensis TaxID=136037 RepID=A0A067QWJ0_ZOONE|nr:uncharacterized protein LOC110835271 [Zootermopsis nevadensis]KDR13598.1 hypothetical protein L798_12287 [Zootermopsis nevadensis]